MNDINELKNKIEKLRQEMYQVYESNPESNEILQISQSLDTLINKYQRLINNSSED